MARRRLSLLALTTVLMARATVPTLADGRIFRCEYLDDATWVNGALSSTATSKDHRDVFGPVIIDTESGVIRQGKDAKPSRLHIVQRGSSSNDFVASFGRDGDLRAASTDFIRVRVWGEPVAIVHFNLSTVLTGICRQI